MVERNTEELPLPALFEQARQIHYAESESSVDQVLLPILFLLVLHNFSSIC